MTYRMNENYFADCLHYFSNQRDQERLLDPPDDVIDYDNSEELIEQERAEAADKAVWEALNRGDPRELVDLIHKVQK